MSCDDQALQQLDQLIDCWPWATEEYERYYLTKLVPAIVRAGGVAALVRTCGGLTKSEAPVVEALSGLLLDEEWARLPELIQSRRAGLLLHLASDDRKAEAQEQGARRGGGARAAALAEQARRQAEEREAREAEARALEQRERLQREAEARAREAREAEARAREQRERLQREAEAQAARERATSLARLQAAFQDDFLTADAVYEVACVKHVSRDDYLKLKIAFVQSWADQQLGVKLDEEQASAVAALGGDVLVTARAGSGKTRTLVTRAIFLQQHCAVKPHELLLLAFNRKAALEMQNRLQTVLKDDIPHVMTFHALAYALVHPDEELLYDEPTAPLQSRVIQQIINAHLRSDEYRPVIRSLMLSHFRDDWERIEKGGFNLSSGEGVKYRRALPRETLAGEYVKSYGEKLIANVLFEHDIDYKYERNFRWNGVNYKPDFTVLLGRDKGVAIEYFGLRGDVDYDEMSDKKREFWRRKQGWTLIELTPRDIAVSGGDDLVGLLQALSQLGVNGRRLSDEEIWQRIERRAVDKFSRAVTSFVRRCRARALGLSDLEYLVAGHSPLTEAEGQFLEVASSVYKGYLERLQEDSLTDFDGLMWDAVDLLATGRSGFARQKGRERGDVRRFRYILVDEFQDFTDVFNELAQSLRRLAPSAEFFCVGDDWQAINGFAGSELRFFRQFTSYFRGVRQVEISTNYRSPSGVVRIGNAVMEGLGIPARAIRRDPGLLHGGRLVDFEPSAAEADRHGGDEGTPAVLRLVKKLLNDGSDVVLLCRTNNVPWYVEYETRLSPLSGLERFEEHVRSYLPEEDRPRVTVSTAHKYKGLEKDAVVVLDADVGSYPLIHPNWVFLRIFGDDLEKLEAEERRLFYVALTRAQAALVILSEHEGTESPYLAAARRHVDIKTLDWSELPPVPSLGSAKLEVRVFFAYDEELNGVMRDKLKYRRDAAGKYWHRLVSADDFDFEAFCRQDWIRPGVRIEVWSEAGILVHMRMF